MHVRSFQIKGRYQRIAFVLALDGVTISLNGFAFVPKEATRARPSLDGSRRGSGVILAQQAQSLRLPASVMWCH